MGLKSFVFSLLPDAIQHSIIMKKTGHLLLRDAPFTDSIRGDIYIPPKSKTWQERLSKPYGHEPEVVKWYERNLREGDVVYDIGAHMGYFGTLVSKIKPTVAFHAFEANWFIAHYLKLNKAHNDKRNKWNITEKFVGHADSGKMVAMDSYMRQNAAPNIFQMDVDGEEINVLSGAKDLLAQATAIFLIEVHPKDLSERHQSTKQFLALFDSSKYDLMYLADLRSDSSRWAASISADDMKNEFYLMASPRGKQRI